MNSFSCVITGHRPTRFKFKYNEKDKRCQRIKKCLQEQLIRLYNQGVRCFWAGGAMGADMWAAEILLRIPKQENITESSQGNRPADIPGQPLPEHQHKDNWRDDQQRQI